MSNLKDKVFKGVMEWNDSGNQYNYVMASIAYDKAETLEEKDKAKAIMDECFAIMYKNFSAYDQAVYELSVRLRDITDGEMETVTSFELGA